MQVARQTMPLSSLVVGVDLCPIKHIPGCISLIEDITTEKCRIALSRELKGWKADVVLSDGAPNVGKNWYFDAFQQLCLTLSAAKLASEYLRPDGWFIAKIFRSKDYNALIWILKQLFKKVYATKPSASRKESAEIFVVAQNYRAPDKIDRRFFDPKYVFEELTIELTKNTHSLKEMLKSTSYKKCKAVGYENINTSHVTLVSEFIAEQNPLSVLANASQIVFNDDNIKNHLLTSPDIIECCNDIKVLGKKELILLLEWHKNLHCEYNKANSDSPRATNPLIDQELPGKVQISDSSSTFEKTDRKDRTKLEKKRSAKKRQKLIEKLNLKMLIEGDEGPCELPDISVFSFTDPQHKPKVLTQVQKSSFSNDEKIEIVQSASVVYSFPNDNSKTCELLKPIAEAKKVKTNSDFQKTPYMGKDTLKFHNTKLWFNKNLLKNISCNTQLNVFNVDSMVHENINKTDYKTRNRPMDETKSRNEIDKIKPLIHSSPTQVLKAQVQKNGPQSFNKEDFITVNMSNIMDKKKARQNHFDMAWNRYIDNEENLPEWFIKDEKETFNKASIVSHNKEQQSVKRLDELHVRSIKKVMEAKARKKRRRSKKLSGMKKKVQGILDGEDTSTQEKTRVLQKYVRLKILFR